MNSYGIIFFHCVENMQRNILSILHVWSTWTKKETQYVLNASSSVPSRPLHVILPQKDIPGGASKTEVKCQFCKQRVYQPSPHFEVYASLKWAYWGHLLSSPMVRLRVRRWVVKSECFDPAICIFFQGTDTTSTFLASKIKWLCPHGRTKMKHTSLQCPCPAKTYLVYFCLLKH